MSRLGTVLHLIYLKPRRRARNRGQRLGTVLHLIYLKRTYGQGCRRSCLGTVLHLIYLKHIGVEPSPPEGFGYCVTFDISQTFFQLESAFALFGYCVTFDISQTVQISQCS